MMTVQELIDQLDLLPKDIPVLVATESPLMKHGVEVVLLKKSAYDIKFAEITTENIMRVNE